MAIKVQFVPEYDDFRAYEREFRKLYPKQYALKIILGLLGVGFSVGAIYCYKLDPSDRAVWAMFFLGGTALWLSQLPAVTAWRYHRRHAKTKSVELLFDEEGLAYDSATAIVKLKWNAFKGWTANDQLVVLPLREYALIVPRRAIPDLDAFSQLLTSKLGAAKY